MDGPQHFAGRKRERGDWGNAPFGNAPQKVPRPRMGEESLRILTRSTDAGSIIGKGGSNIKRLRQQYNCLIHFPECPGSAERVLTINGTRENIINCMGEIVPKINETAHRGAPNFTTEVQILVPEPYMGTIIGSGGQKVKAQRKESNAAIKIFSESLPGSNERSVSVTGGKNAILSCVHYVLSELAEVAQKNESRGPIYLYDPSSVPFDPFMEFPGPPGPPMGGRGGPRNLPPHEGPPRDGGGWRGRGRGRGRGNGNGAPPPMGRRDGPPGGGGGMNNRDGFSSGGGGGRGMPPPPTQFGGQGPPPMQGVPIQQQQLQQPSPFDAPAPSQPVPLVPLPPAQSGPMQAQQVTIPNQYSDAILGVNGSRLEQTIRQSSCEIIIENPRPGSAERIINIKGLPNNIQLAQTIMQNNVRQFHNLP